jgi:Fe-S-cluster containining protein
VDELAKPAGRDCVHQRGGSAGCGIYDSRPPICRGYKCLWLQGGLEDDERPDRTGGIVDLEPRGTGVQLGIREVRRGAFDDSPMLQAIADRYREEMPVRISDTADLMNPDRPFRVLMAKGVEHHVEGEWSHVFQDGVLVADERLGWAERCARRLGIWWRMRRLRRTLTSSGTSGGISKEAPKK